jgi:hypothetical protein
MRGDPRGTYGENLATPMRFALDHTIILPPNRRFVSHVYGFLMRIVLWPYVVSGRVYPPAASLREGRTARGLRQGSGVVD